MPHVMLDYSANLEDRADMAGLCNALRQAAIATGLFPVAGVRVRALRADHASIADGDAAHGYIDITVRLRGGRSLAARQAAAQRIFDAAREFLAPLMAIHPLALSLEMRDIDPDLAPKAGTIRDYLKQAGEDG